MNRLMRGTIAAAVLAACAPSAGSGEGSARPDRNVISLEEVHAARVDNAYELVRQLHPMWLQKRGANSLGNDGEIVVYLNETRLGGPEALRQLETISITSIRYFDAGAATYRFGAGHHHGAIQVSTRLALE